MKDKFKKHTKQIIAVVGVLVITISLPYVLKLVSKPTEYKKVTATDLAVNLWIEPVNQTISTGSEAEMKVMVNPNGNKLSFTRVAFYFDTTKIKIKDGSTINTTPLISRIIQLTDPFEANNTGMVVVVLAVPPGESTDIPDGTELASFIVVPVSTVANDATSIYFFEDSVAQNVQIVDVNAVSLTKTVSGVSLTLNPTVPTLIPTAIPSVTIAPTIAPTPFCAGLGESCKTVDCCEPFFEEGIGKSCICVDDVDIREIP